MIEVHDSTGLSVHEIYDTWGLNQFSAYYETLVEIESAKTIRLATAIRAGFNATGNEFDSWVESLQSGAGSPRRKRGSMRDKEYTIDDVPTFDGADDFDWETIDGRENIR